MPFNTNTRTYDPPSEPAIRRFLQDVDAHAVDEAFSEWLQSLSGKNDAIAVDGKTLKGAVIAQCPVEERTNLPIGKTGEIPAVRTLLDPLDITGSVVTLDALHTQKDTARYLVEQKHADYLFTVKDNQSTLRQYIEDLSLVSFPPSAPNG